MRVQLETRCKVRRPCRNSGVAHGGLKYRCWDENISESQSRKTNGASESAKPDAPCPNPSVLNTKPLVVRLNFSLIKKLMRSSNKLSRSSFLDNRVIRLRITFQHRRGDVAEWLKAAVC